MPLNPAPQFSPPDFLSNASISHRTSSSHQNERLCIVVPFRDGCSVHNSGAGRENNLILFRAYLARHLFASNPLLNYTIIVAEQEQREAFNRGFLFNHGYKFGLAHFQCDYFSFHDVDQVPLSLMNTYANEAAKVQAPVHQSSNMSMNFFCPMNNVTMGGVVMMTASMYAKINGFSNLFYGWGMEDDNALDRIRHHFGDSGPFRLDFEAGAYMSLAHEPVDLTTSRATSLYDKEKVLQYQRKVLSSGVRGRMGVSRAEAARLGIPNPEVDGLVDLDSRTLPGSLRVVETAERYVRFKVEVLTRNGSRADVCQNKALSPRYVEWISKTQNNSVTKYSYRFVPRES